MFILMKSGNSFVFCDIIKHVLYLLVRASWTAWQQHWLNEQWCVFETELCVFCFNDTSATRLHTSHWR